MSLESIMEVIKTRSLSWRSDFLTPFVELQFKYEEEDNPDEFFTPYVWALVTTYSGLHWHSETIKLFSTENLPDEPRQSVEEQVDNLLSTADIQQKDKGETESVENV